MSEETVEASPAEDRSALKRAVADPVSRRRFLTLAGGSGAAAAFLVACGDDDDSMSSGTSDTTSDTTTDMDSDNPLAQFGEGDIGIVNYALTLEYLEAAFYADVIKSGFFRARTSAADGRGSARTRTGAGARRCRSAAPCAARGEG